MLEEAVEILSEECPLCGAPVSESRLAQLQQRVREEEREKLETATDRMRADLEATHLRKVEELTAAAADRENRLLEDLGARLETQRAAHLADIVAQREDARIDAIAAMAAEVDAAKADRKRIADEMAGAEARAAAAAEVQRIEREAGVAEATRQHEEDLRKLRAALEKDKDDQLRLLNRQRIDEQETWKKKVGDLQRSLEKKTAHELGEWPEIDIYTQLKEVFTEDRIRRVQKGDEGADVVMEVRHRGEVCGTIVIDSKNRKAWRDSYTQKLRDDRDAAKADHAILATSVFPQGERDLCIRDDVLVVRPHSVVTLVRVLRDFIQHGHVQELSKQQRDAKTARLYEYFNSGEFGRSLASARKIGEDLEEVDLEERKAHEKVWLRRGTLHRKLGRSVGSIQTNVDSIVEGNAAKKPGVAS